MFQKLYKNIEYLINNGRDHLLVAQEQLAATNEQLSALRENNGRTNDLADRITSLDHSIRSQNKPFAPSQVRVVALLLSSAGVVILVLMCYFTFKLSESARKSLQRSEESDRLVKIACGRYDELERTQAARKAEIGKLDSLVFQQSQSIEELKKLNKTAVRTYAEIRRDLQKSVFSTR